MTVDEFLRWDDGTETRYELIGGVPQGMAPTLRGHRLVVGNTLVAIRAILRPPVHGGGQRRHSVAAS